jgi:putative flavoprotein involved in K+ transport
MTRDEVVSFLDLYARKSRAPVQEHARVVSVRSAGRGFRVTTTAGTWHARAVVVATGYCDLPTRPAAAAGLSGCLTQVFPHQYKTPRSLPPGGVLVVGASATGLQLADELRRDGRRVVLAVGHHTRVPRLYRGRDILWWLDRMGIMRDEPSQVYDLTISREQPSFQLVGGPDHASLTLQSLRDGGVIMAGRFAGADGLSVRFADDLVATTAAADAKLALLLQRIDRFADAQGSAPAEGADAFTPLWPAFPAAPDRMDLSREGVTSVLWATGFQRHYPWLHVPVFTSRGEIAHTSGVTASPGLYVLGLHFLRRRNSSFIDGVGNDAQWLSGQAAAHLQHRRPARQMLALSA